MKSMWAKTLVLLDRYSIVVAALVIYSYFLLTSINLMEHAKTKRTFIDFVLQFDSLILLWIIAFVVVQLQKYRKLTNEQESQSKQMQLELEGQRARLRLLDEVTLLFRQSLDKPLAVVSTTTQNLRKKYGQDAEARSWVDHIDFAMARVTATVSDIKTYETQKIIGDSPITTAATGPLQG